jgi:hypothetical protein
MYNFIVHTLKVVEQDSPQELASVSIVMFGRKEYSCMISANVGVKLRIVRFLTLHLERLYEGLRGRKAEDERAR